MSEESKPQLRAALLAARRALPDADRAAARAAICAAVLEHAGAWTCVAAYEPLRTEPGSVDLLAGLTAAGIEVLVPITRPDHDLDWRHRDDTAALGAAAIARADAVLVPALAVARDGTRLGRGGGSYDRALVRAAPTAIRAALLYEDELVGLLPRAPWDVPVTAVVRPSGWTDLA